MYANIQPALRKGSGSSRVFEVFFWMLRSGKLDFAKLWLFRRRSRARNASGENLLPAVQRSSLEIEMSPRTRATAKSATADVLIPEKLYFRIGEVSRLCHLPAYVLRFWETEFPQLKPVKSSTGQRMYRRKDVESVFASSACSTKKDSPSPVRASTCGRRSRPTRSRIRCPSRRGRLPI